MLQFTNVLKWPQSTWLRQHPGRSNILEMRHIRIFTVSAMPSSNEGWLPMMFNF
jgi:hypothetical protein